MVLLGSRTRWVAGVVVLCAAVIGCGDGPEMSSVTGQVTYQGQPVPGGKVMFAPLREGNSSETKSRPGVGIVGPDGRFTVTTYSRGDGSAIGRHSVIYYPPSGEDIGEDDTSDEIRTFFADHVLQMEDQLLEVEIKSGKNDFEIKMIDYTP